ncbi:MFS transporter [Rhodococcus aerolatus]
MTSTTAPAARLSRADRAAESAAAQRGGGAMTHRQILEALSGMLLGLFVAILSSTVVSNALPTILRDLDGGETAYTWVVTATLLTTTVTTPIWGKLSDLFSKKLLVQLALVIFVISSAVAGLSTSTAMLITCRAFQGVGVGGLTALTQVILAAMISPRERGRYAGYLGAVFALATVSGPLIGGVLVDTSWLGWRWCFYVGVPFAVIGLVVLQRTLHLPTVKREVHIDYAGATLLTGSVSLLLIWVSLAGKNFAWASTTTAVMVGAAVVLLVATLVAESRAAEPIIPLRLFRNRTVSASSVASLLTGIALFGATVFLAQYFQISRGVSATMSGIMTLPLIGGLFVSSTVSGRVITATGRWKRYMVAGGVSLTAGVALMSLARQDTAYVLLAVYMALIGIGVGMLLQNLVLAVQNTVDVTDLGAASSVVVFFRTLGGAIGVSALGAALSDRVTTYTEQGLARIGVAGGESAGATGIPDFSAIPAPVADIIRDAYGRGTGFVFLLAAPVALLVLLAVLTIKEVPLRTSNSLQQADEDTAAERSADEGSAPAAVPADADDPAHDAGPDTADGVTAGPGVVAGRVTGPDGAPVAGAVLTLTDLASHQLDLARSDDDGTFRLATAEGGTVLLVCAAPDLPPTASLVVVEGPVTTRDVVLVGTGEVSGTVRSAGDGRALPEATVTVLDAAGVVVASVVTGADGRYRVPDLRPADYTVVTTGLAPSAATVTVGSGADAELDVALHPAAVGHEDVRAAAGHHARHAAR